MKFFNVPTNLAFIQLRSLVVRWRWAFGICCRYRKFTIFSKLENTSLRYFLVCLRMKYCPLITRYSAANAFNWLSRYIRIYREFWFAKPNSLTKVPLTNGHPMIWKRFDVIGKTFRTLWLVSYIRCVLQAYNLCQYFFIQQTCGVKSSSLQIRHFTVCVLLFAQNIFK